MIPKTLKRSLQKFTLWTQRHSANRPANSQVTQLSLVNAWQLQRRLGASPPDFADVGFREYSQNEEDGILLYIFTVIGTKNRTCVEICCGDGIECNCANLIINHGWTGYLVDGNPKNIAHAETFYKWHPSCRIWPPVCESHWITAENINTVIDNAGFHGEIDLLSIDVDGMDLWLWKALDVVRPRVVVIEINHRFGDVKSVVTPYKPDFQTTLTSEGSVTAGASLQAMIKTGDQKGYYFAGTNKICTNAFFILKEEMQEWLPEKKAADCFSHPRVKHGIKTYQSRLAEENWTDI